MKTISNIKFSLDKYNSGRYLVKTREGNSVRIVCTDCKNKNPIIGIVKLPSGKENIIVYTINGNYWNEREKHKDDLFLEEEVIQDGDVVSFGSGAIGIFKEYDEHYAHEDYVTLLSGNYLSYHEDKWSNSELRLATEEEKELLFSKLKEFGKKWNSIDKRIEDIDEDSDDACMLEPFQKVLVRGYDYTTWKPSLFGYYVEDDKFPYRCIGGSYIQCIPYEGNENLLGTDNNPLL